MTKATQKTIPNCPTYIILGSGGHTAEMCKINKALLESSDTRTLYQPCYYLVAASDTTSRRKIIDTMRDIDISLSAVNTGDSEETVNSILTNVNSGSFIDVPRSRQVGQSWLTTIFTSLWALLVSFWLVWRDRPELLLCNGPGTCVPFCVAAYCLRLVGRLPRKSKIVFIESYCRVQTMSLSGRLLQPLVDLLVVQWEPLFRKYCRKSNVKFFGRLM